MLCEIGWEIRRYGIKSVRLVVMGSLGDHKRLDKVTNSKVDRNCLDCSISAN